MTFDEGGQHMSISDGMMLESTFSHVQLYIPMTQNQNEKSQCITTL